MFNNAGKQVIYNDLLAFNYQIGLALIENAAVTLTDADLAQLLTAEDTIAYPDFIQKSFSGIYFTDEENAWLDRVVHHIHYRLENPVKQALARFALFQACMIKRPYNLFHRANLYMRTAQVERGFGNKTTWDTPFEVHFRTFITQANQAVFDNGRRNLALQCDALETPVGVDLVYIDPPYLNSKGTGVNYRDFYHFLEGLVNYESWPAHIDYTSKHRRLQPQPSVWNSALTIVEAFEQLIQRHQASILVISYRDDGIPSKEQLVQLLRRYKRQVYEASQPKQYVLSHKKSHELLLIGL
jgi:DNA adenine methylase/adenine-specific DNA-methyltransferase